MPSPFSGVDPYLEELSKLSTRHRLIPLVGHGQENVLLKRATMASRRSLP